MVSASIGVYLAAASAGIAVFCALQALFGFLSALESEKSEVDRNAVRNLSVMFKLLLPIARQLSGVASSSGLRNFREGASVRLAMAGISDALSAADFVGLRIAFWGLGGVFALLLAARGFMTTGILLGVMIGIYPGAWLKTTIKKRQLQIMKALPNVLDLLTLSVESGKDFLTSLRDILARRKMDALGEELWRTFQEIQLGRKRSEALREMSLRVRHSELTSVLNAIIQADELGVSIGQLLRIQGDMLRNKRFTLAEKIANETPVKILFPVIVFIFPAVIIILMVPILMQAFRLMS